MREPKYRLYLTSEERSILVNCLINMKNSLIQQGKYTDGVDDVLCKVVTARSKKVKVERI